MLRRSRWSGTDLSGVDKDSVLSHLATSNQFNVQACVVLYVAVIADFTIPIGDFALAETLQHRSDMEFEIDRVAAHDTNRVVPFVRATRGDFEDLTQILEDDPSVEEVELLAETGDEQFYRLVWVERAEIIGYMVAEQGATVQEATAGGGEWHLRVFFPERRGLSATDDYANENGVSLNVERIYGVDALSQVQYDLTDDQHETLTRAAEQGYYTIPRDISMEDLADDLDISHQALSERFRRAHLSLVENTLLIEEEDDEEDDEEG
jgi:predicted DNA binding protein